MNLHQKKKSKTLKSRTKIPELRNLKGKSVFYAPKIYDHQIFSDVYDSIGNHDRIIDISNSYRDDQLIINGNLVISTSIEGGNNSISNVKPPDNSCLEETKAPVNDFHLDIFNKLSALARNQKKIQYKKQIINRIKS
jgi:hypothetical protein